jgi:integrase
MAKALTTHGGARRTRGAASKLHPGVSVTAYDSGGARVDPDDPRAESWRVRSNDPINPKRATLDRWFRRAQGGEYDGVVAFAVRHSVKRVEQKEKRGRLRVKAELYNQALPAGDAKPRHTIVDTCGFYVRMKLESEKRSTRTKRNANDALELFIQWCRTRGLRYMDQLTQSVLVDFHTWLIVDNRRLDGRPYARSTVNLQLKYPRAMLYLALKKGRYDVLPRDKVQDALEHTPIEKASQRIRYELDGAKSLGSVDEIRRLLRAAIAYDQRSLARTRYRRCPDAAPRATVDVVNMLFSGLRLQEYTYLRVRAVTESAEETLEIKVLGKGSEPRDVYYRGFSPLGAEIMLASIRSRKKSEWLSEHTYGAMRSMLGRLRKYGAPDLSPHDLRATCATFQMALGDVDANRRAARLGHEPELQHRRYILKGIRGLKYGAVSIEDAMQCEDLLREILTLVSAAPPRRMSDDRDMPTQRFSQALLAKDPERALTESFALAELERARRAARKKAAA